MVDYIDWFSNVELALCIRSKSHLVFLYIVVFELLMRAY